MWSVVWFEGGCPVGRRIRFLFPAPTHSPREVTESGEASRVSAWAEYLDPYERPEWGAGEGS